MRKSGEPDLRALLRMRSERVSPSVQEAEHADLNPRAAICFHERHQSEEGGIGTHDHACRDGFEIIPVAPLGLEARAKVRAGQMPDNARRDAAGDKDAAARAIGEGDIAGDSAEHGAKLVERRETHSTCAIERACGDAGGIALRDIHAVDGRNRPIEIFQSAARHRALRRHVFEMPAQMTDDRLFAVGGGGQCDVAAFARDHNRTLRPGNEACDAEARSRAEHGHGRVCDRRAAAERMQIVLGQMRQRVSGGLEVVEQAQCRKAECVAQFGSVDLPRAIGEGATLAIDRRRDREHGAGNGRLTPLAEKSLQRAGEMRMIGHRNRRDRAERAVRQQGKSGVGRTNVAQHNMLTRRGHGILREQAFYR